MVAHRFSHRALVAVALVAIAGCGDGSPSMAIRGTWRQVSSLEPGAAAVIPADALKLTVGDSSMWWRETGEASETIEYKVVDEDAKAGTLTLLTTGPDGATATVRVLFSTDREQMRMVTRRHPFPMEKPDPAADDTGSFGAPMVFKRQEYKPLPSVPSDSLQSDSPAVSDSARR
jgi:hypothetical protein